MIKHCVAAEPRHGEVWQGIAKKPDNWRLTTRDVLKLALKALPAL